MQRRDAPWGRGDAPAVARGTRPAQRSRSSRRASPPPRAAPGHASTALPARSSHPAAPPSPTREPWDAFSVRKCPVGGVEEERGAGQLESRRGREVRGRQDGAGGAARRAPLSPAECEHERRGWRWGPGGRPQLRPPLHPLQQTPGLAIYQPGRLRDRVRRPARRLEGPGGPEMPAGAAARQVTGGRGPAWASRAVAGPSPPGPHPAPERARGRPKVPAWVPEVCGSDPAVSVASLALIPRGKGIPRG